MGHLEGITFIDSRGDGRYLISNGKDQAIKLWDIRKMSSNATWYDFYYLVCYELFYIMDEVGIFMIVHFVDVKRWVLEFCTNSFRFSYQGIRNYEWDYRWMDYPPQARDLKHPYDQSISTYKGHSVLRTLIRCYFSPEYRSVYTIPHMLVFS